MNGIKTHYTELKNKIRERNLSDILMWFLILFILFFKSEMVLASIYGTSSVVFLVGCISFSPILFLISFAFCFPPKGNLIFLLLMDIFISLLFIADMMYDRAFGHLISIYMIYAGTAVEGIGTGVISLIHLTDLLLLVDIPFLFFVVIKFKKAARVKGRMFLFLFACLMSASVIVYAFHWIEDNKLLADNTFHPLMMSPIGNHMYDLYRFIYDKNEVITPAQQAEVAGWFEANKKFLEPDEEYSSLSGLIRGKNIITIQCESLENFVINASFDGQEVTPNINRLLDQSIYFSNIVEQVGDGNSSDAELMFNTSVYPISSGSAFLRFGDNGYTSLPLLLNQQGYTSMAIHGDSRTFWNRDQVFPKLGFDRYIDESQFRNKSTLGLGVLDESLFSQTILEVDKLKQPFNVFAITLTSHMPFEPITSLTPSNDSNSDISTRYLNSIHYTDKTIGTLINHLKASGRLKDTIVVIYGDHEGIHKYYDTTLPDNNYRIPFIVYIPGLDGFALNKIGGQIDMMPTLAFLLGLDKSKYENSVMGRNLFGKYSGSGMLASGDVISGVDDPIHLAQALGIADICINTNYFASGLK